MSTTATDSLLERFLRYVKIDTQADEHSDSYPSTAKQLDLSRLLEAECRELGLADVSMNEHGIVVATIPATPGCDAPTIAWFAHVDTSPETSGTDVKPIVHENYDGKDIVLPGAPDKVIRVAENQKLEKLHGASIITTDGTTLLGADDKSGIAVILTAAQHLLANPDIAHGPIRICFTCDEEIGRGTIKIDLDEIDAVCGYTLDSEGTGMIDGETFSADLAIVTVTGINTHPSMGKDKMVNAIRILSDFIAALPAELSPEHTAGRDGFIHPYEFEGSVASARAQMILRDFETAALADQAALLERTAAPLREANPKAAIDIEIRKQYRNMRDGLPKEPRALALGVQANKAVLGTEPEVSIIRGGTDGSALTELGLPTPNLSSGQHNPHSPLEWTSVEEMETCTKVLVELAKLWGKESQGK